MTQGKYLCVCTDLKLKGWRYLMPFFKLAGPVFEQSRATPGNVKTDRRGNPLTLRFQTLTVWQDRESMDTFVYGEPHRTAIAKFEEWSAEDSRISRSSVVFFMPHLPAAPRSAC